MIDVLVFGTFDHLHKGHRHFLQSASARGDRLTAVVSADAFVMSTKGRNPHHNQQIRMKMLEKSGLVNRVLPADYPVGGWEILDRERPDVICLGHDQWKMKDSLETWLETKGSEYQPKIFMLQAYQRSKYSSSRISRIKQGRMYILLVLAMCLWGYSWVSGKQISTMASPLTLLFWRFLISAASFLPFTLKGNFRDLKKEQLGGIFLSALCLSAYGLLFFYGLGASLAGKSGVIVTTSIPLFTLILSRLIFKVKTTLLQKAGFLLGLGGGIILLEPWLFSGRQFMESSNLLFLLAALCWSGLTLLSKKIQEKTGVFLFNFMLYLMASLMALSLCTLNGVNPFQVQGLGWNFWGNILYMSVAAGGMATGLYLYAGVVLGTARSSSFTFLVPGSALFFSALILQEIPGILTLVATVLCSAAIVLINLRKGK